MAFFPLLFFQKSEGCFNQGEAMKLKIESAEAQVFIPKACPKVT